MKDSSYPDKLIVTGLGRLDGEYDCDLTAMLTLDHPQALTNREMHRIKTMSGVTAGRLADALSDGDSDVLLALAAIVLARHGKRFDEDTLWDAPMGSGVTFHIADREEEEDLSPPASTPPSDGGESSSSETAALRASGPSPTGSPSSAMPSTAPDSPQETSEI